MGLFRNLTKRITKTVQETVSEASTEAVAGKLDIWGDVASIGILALVGMSALRSGKHDRRESAEQPTHTVTNNYYYYGDTREGRR